jgi:hypothetical protein
MPALNFQARFAEPVEQREKRTTIRRERKDIWPGRMLYLYTGMRTKGCCKLGESLCCGVTRVRIDSDGRMCLGSQWLDYASTAELARVDTAGLLDADQFIAFFRETYTLPFVGVLITWL